MSMQLLDRQFPSEVRRSRYPSRPIETHSGAERRVRRKSNWRPLFPPATDDDELKFISRAVMWMLVFAMTPMLLFHLLNYVFPDILHIPIAPN